MKSNIKLFAFPGKPKLFGSFPKTYLIVRVRSCNDISLIATGKQKKTQETHSHPQPPPPKKKEGSPRPSREQCGYKKKKKKQFQMIWANLSSENGIKIVLWSRKLNRGRKGVFIY